jgi:hypothetical protein
MTEPVKIWSHHEVVKWVSERVAAGTFRNCAHLTVIALKQRRAMGTAVVFVPDCKRRSFAWKRAPMDRQDEFEQLTMVLRSEPMSCPHDCVNYVSERRVSLLRPLSKLQLVARYLVVPFEWFGKLPWQTQVVVILLFVLIAARPLIPLIIQLLKAYHGQ